MSKTSFNKVIVSNELLLTLRGNMVGANIVNTNYSGEVSKLGDQVKILTPAGVTVRTYTTNADMTIDELSGDDQALVINTANAFAFYAHDVDRIADYVSAFVADGAHNLVDAADKAVFGLYTGAAAANKVEADVTDDLLEVIREARRKLSVSKVPESGRFLVISPFELEAIEEKLTARQTGLGDNVVGTGFAGQLYGFDVYVSPNLVEASDVRHLLAGSRAAITFADAIVDVESIRAEKRFADIVRGLHVFGSKVVRPEALADIAIDLDPS